MILEKLGWELSLSKMIIKFYPNLINIVFWVKPLEIQV